MCEEARFCEVCGEGKLPLDDNDWFYVIGLHCYVCSPDCYNVIITETFSPLEEVTCRD